MLSYTNCNLCPRRCGVDRTKGQPGFCRQPDKIFAARAAAHYWEEPVISGSYGSGAVFFFRLHASLLLLPKRNHIPRKSRKRNIHAAPAGNFFKAD